MDNTETRNQTLKKLDFYLPRLTDRELRMVAAFVRGMTKGRIQENDEAT